MSESQSSTNTVWESLVAGDPGPAVALFDSLLNGDFGHAAGGLLRDLADATVDVDNLVTGDSEQKQFLATVEAAMLCCLQGDQEEVQGLINEAKEADGFQ